MTGIEKKASESGRLRADPCALESVATLWASHEQKGALIGAGSPLNALRAFEGVAKHGSFTAAANASPNISQSALSRHVIALERLVGVQLFDQPHALSLTKGTSTPLCGGSEVLRSAGICTR